MARIRPFHGVRYDVSRVGDLAQVVAPPYDVIDRAYAERLGARHQCNAVHLDWTGGESGGGGALYPRAATVLRDWLRTGCLTRDRDPSIYPYQQTYATGAGERRTRYGFFALVRITEYGDEVHPHEHTHAEPLADRLDLMRATRANLSPIFGLYSDPAHRVLARVRMATHSGVSWHDADGIEHRLARIGDVGVIAEVARGLRGKAIVIADGHHRYEAALRYARERRARGMDLGSVDHVLMYLTEVEDEGLTVLPIHRLLSTLEAGDAARLAAAIERDFAIEPADGLAGLTAEIERQSAAGNLVIGHVELRRTRLLRARRGTVECLIGAGAPGESAGPRPLPSEIFTHSLLETGLDWRPDVAIERGRLRYATDGCEVERVLREGTYNHAFLMPRTPVGEIAERARRGQRMPQKSTYFYPKVPTGVVFNLFD